MLHNFNGINNRIIINSIAIFSSSLILYGRGVVCNYIIEYIYCMHVNPINVSFVCFAPIKFA